MVSAQAKDLVKNLLLFDPEKRFSAQQALNHDWIKLNGKQEVGADVVDEVLGNLKKFSAQHKLQQASLTYMVSQLTTKSEKENLRKVFMALDKTGTGKLSKADLVSGYKQMFGDLCHEEEDITKLVNSIDTDHSGFIDYTEFAVAAINKKTLLSRERLIAAFKMFDKVKLMGITE